MRCLTAGIVSGVARPAQEARLKRLPQPLLTNFAGPEPPMAPLGAVAALHLAKRSPRSGLVGCAAVMAGVLASTGSGSEPVQSAAGRAPGSVQLDKRPPAHVAVLPARRLVVQYQV